MNKQELIQIEDRDEFLSLLSKAKISNVRKISLMRERRDYLYQIYRAERFKDEEQRVFNHA